MAKQIERKNQAEEAAIVADFSDAKKSDKPKSSKRAAERKSDSQKSVQAVSARSEQKNKANSAKVNGSKQTNTKKNETKPKAAKQSDASKVKADQGAAEPGSTENIINLNSAEQASVELNSAEQASAEPNVTLANSAEQTSAEPNSAESSAQQTESDEGKIAQEKGPSIIEEKFAQAESTINENLQSDEEKQAEKVIGISQELVDEKMKEVLATQTPKKRRKSTIINLTLLLVNIVFMIFIVKNLLDSVEGGSLSFSTLISLQGSRLWWFVGGLGIYCVFIFAQVLMYKVLIKDLTGKSRWGLSYDVAVVGKYYDNVTPFAVGGQPMQIVRLATHGISPGVSTSIPIIKMIINNAMNMILALVFFIFVVPKIPLTTPFNDILLLLFEILGVIGVIITVIVVLFMFLISSGSLFTRSFISGLLRLGYKLKIVKNYRASLKKTINQFAEYRASMSYLWKHKKLLLKMILLCFVECITYASMPFFVVMSFVTPESMGETLPVVFFFICIARYYVCAMASSYIPLPGGTGLMEISFILLFGTIPGITNYKIVWMLLMWRFLSYYLIIIHGFVHELRKIIQNIIKNNKLKRQERANLAAGETENVSQN